MRYLRLLQLTFWPVLASTALGSYGLEQGSPSGGTAVGINTDNSTTSLSYSIGPDGGYGGATGGSASASCSGEITFRFVWSGSQQPPSSVLLKVTSTAHWNGSNGSCSNGLGHQEVLTRPPQPPGAPPYQGRSSGTTYIVRNDPGLTFDYNIEPTANVSPGSVDVKVFVEVADAFDVSMLHHTSALQLLDWDENFGYGGGNAYEVQGCVRNLNGTWTTNPILHVKDLSLVAELTHLAGKTGIAYSLSGSLSGNYYPSTSLTSTGQYQTVSFTSGNRLQAKVYSLNYDTLWNAGLGTPYNQTLNATTPPSGHGTVYVTWAAPLNGEAATLHRVRWAVTTASGASDEVQVADAIWAGLGGDAPYEPGEKNLVLPADADEWQLLDVDTNYFGECDEQARLMRRALRLLGVDGRLELVRASSNVDVLDLESHTSKYVPGKTDYLIYYFPAANAFEATYVLTTSSSPTGEYWYAVWPQEVAESALGILRALCRDGAIQRWVTLENGVRPGDDEWWDNIIYIGERVDCP